MEEDYVKGTRFIFRLAKSTDVSLLTTMAILQTGPLWTKT